MNLTSKTLNILIVGAGSTRQGTGPYIANFFKKMGHQIHSVICSSKESTEKAVIQLKDNFQIETIAAESIDSALSKRGPIDLVVIASPASTHGYWLEQCIEQRLPFFCEKPFLWSEGGNNLQHATSLINSIKSTNLPFWVNTQWNQSLSAFGAIYPEFKHSAVKTLEMELSPASTDLNMLIDALPHAWAMLLELAGSGDIQKLHIKKASKTIEMDGSFKHLSAETNFKFHLNHSNHQPRHFAYAINGNRVERLIDMKDYSLSFMTERGIFPIYDPLEAQVRKICDWFADPAASSTDNPDLVLQAMKLLNDSYIKAQQT